MHYSTITLEKLTNYAIITLNRPDKLNALNKKMFDELNDAIISIEIDSDIRALIITGSGEKAFAAGADIAELHDNNERSGKLFSDYGSKVMARIEQLTIPVIGLINGFALGGGCELAMCCHLRFASSNAKFGQPELNLGIIPGYGGTQRLTRLVGKPKAMEMILTCEIINAEKALEIGLVNGIFPQSEIMDKVIEFVNVILSKSPIAVSNAIECINSATQLSLPEGLAYESARFGDVCGSEDFKEGTLAFLEKRPAVFIGK